MLDRRTVGAAIALVTVVACSGPDEPRYRVPVDCLRLIERSDELSKAVEARLHPGDDPPVSFHVQPHADPIGVQVAWEGQRGWAWRCLGELEVGGYETESRSGEVPRDPPSP